MTDWFDDDSFWKEMYPYMFPESRMQAAADEVDKILALTGVKGGAALDLCCGPGRHSIQLAKRGFEVTGVDRTAFFLEKARERAAAENAKVEWVKEDMRRFVRPSAYDLALSLFTAFGYFEKESEDEQVAAHLFRCLKPGGACLIDVKGKESIAKIFSPAISERFPDGTLLVQLNELVNDWTRTRNEWILIRGKEAKSFTFMLNIYSGRELRDLLKRAGFESVRLYGTLDGAGYGLDAPRLIAVAKKGS